MIGKKSKTGKKPEAPAPAPKPDGNIDPAFEDLAPKGEEKKVEKRPYRKRKETLALFEDRFFSLIWEQTFNRIFPKQPLSPEESVNLGSQTNRVVSKYIPEILARYADEAALIFTFSMALYPRWMSKKELKEKDKKEIPENPEMVGISSNQMTDEQK